MRNKTRKETYKKKQKNLTAIDLFSGCGGMSLGLRQAGFSVIGANDIDALAVETYKLNHEQTYVWQQDIRTLSVNDVMKQLDIKKGELDLLAGCPPCQGFSSMRTKNKKIAADDPRNDLILEFARFVRELFPRSVMMENVPGLVHDSRLNELQAELESMGYRTKIKILDAADYGVPQRRRRLILVGALNKPVRAAKSTKRKKTVKETIGGLPKVGDSGDACHDIPEARSKRVVNLIKKIPKDGGSRQSLGKRGQLACHKKCNGFKDVYGRMSWGDVAPTITGGCVNPSKGRFIHPQENRAITLREAALLQSFPSTYTFSLKRGKHNAAVMIGNALPPEFIRRHAKAIATTLSTQ